MRNTICDVMVLKTRRQGDYDKQLILFSAGLGLVYASVYGAYRSRSRLAGSTEQFTRLKAYLYHNPVKNSWKVSDAEVLDQYSGLRGSLEKIMAASAGAEIIMKTEAAGGEEKRLYSILIDLFHYLDTGTDEDIDYLIIQFLYRYIEISGSLPDFSACPECGREIGGNRGMVFSPEVPGFSCSRCGGAGARSVPEGIRRYLMHTRALPWEQALRVRMDRKSAGECREILAEYVQALVEVPIYTLQKGGQMT